MNDLAASAPLLDEKQEGPSRRSRLDPSYGHPTFLAPFFPLSKRGKPYLRGFNRQRAYTDRRERLFQEGAVLLVQHQRFGVAFDAVVLQPALLTNRLDTDGFALGLERDNSVISKMKWL
jgi:hypothetical protein